MRGDLLVARRNQRDAVARLIERVEHADIAVPADAEDIGNVVGDQIFGDQLGALHSRHCRSLPAIAGLTRRHSTGRGCSSSSGGDYARVAALLKT